MPRPLKWGILGANTIILSKDIDKYAFMCGSNFYESDFTYLPSCKTRDWPLVCLNSDKKIFEGPSTCLLMVLMMSWSKCSLNLLKEMLHTTENSKVENNFVSHKIFSFK